MHLSQPALSRSIKALEDELRVSLFDRTNRRLHPTPFAMEYLERAKRIVFDEREGARTLSLMKNGAYGQPHRLAYIVTDTTWGGSSSGE